VVEPPTPLKNDGVKASWDYDILNMMGKIIHSCSKAPVNFMMSLQSCGHFSGDDFPIKTKKTSGWIVISHLSSNP